MKRRRSRRQRRAEFAAAAAAARKAAPARQAKPPKQGGAGPSAKRGNPTLPTQQAKPIKPVRIVADEVDAQTPVELLDAHPPVVVDRTAESVDAPLPKSDQATVLNGPLADKSGGLTLKQRALRSSMWTLTAFALGQVIRFVSAPLTANLLDNAGYLGVATLVPFFVTLLLALSDVGVELAIVQNKRGDDPIFLDTAFTVHVVRGFILFLASCALAYPVYWLYRDQPQAEYLLWMIPASGLSPIINGFCSTSIFTLNRHLQMGRLTVINLIWQVVAVGVQLWVAWKWRTPWALIAGGLASNLYYTIVSHFLIPGYRNRFRWDPAVRKELMKFGKWILISTLITYTASQIDRPLMGKLTDLKWLGVYGIAMSLVLLPREVIGRLAAATLFPLLSRTAETDPAALPRVLGRARGLVMTAALATTVGVVLGGPLFVVIFYKPEYHAAAWLCQLASVSGWFILLQTTADRALVAKGLTKPLATSNAVNLVVSVVGCVAGMYIERHLTGDPAGITGFLLGLGVGKMAGHLMIQIEMAKAGMPIYRQDTLYSAILVALCAAGIVAPRLADRWQPGNEVLHQGAAAVLVCAVACAWAGLRVKRGIR